MAEDDRAGGAITGIIVATLAVGTAGLTAIGLTQDSLERALRNHGKIFTLGFTLLVLAALLLAAARVLLPTSNTKTVKRSWTSSPGEKSAGGAAAIQDDGSTAREAVMTRSDPPGVAAAPAAACREPVSVSVEEQTTAPVADPRRIVRLRRQSASVCGALGVLVVVAATTLLIITGAIAGEDRENPGITLQAGSLPTTGAPAGNGRATVDERTFAVKVSARGTSLRSDEDLLVQVIGIRAGANLQRQNDTDREGLRSACESNHGPDGNFEALAVDADILLWNRQGPDPKGAVTGAWTIAVPPRRYRLLCAWTIYGNGHTERNGDQAAQTASAYLALLPPVSA